MYIDLTTFTGACNANLGSLPKHVVFKLTQQKHPKLLLSLKCHEALFMQKKEEKKSTQGWILLLNLVINSLRSGIKQFQIEIQAPAFWAV